MKRYHHFVLLVALLCGTTVTHAQPAPQNVTFDGETFTTQVNCEVVNAITAGNTTVKNGSDVTLVAGSNIRLEAGFKIEKGATFSADVDPSSGRRHRQLRDRF
jgi:hypothetical protein